MMNLLYCGNDRVLDGMLISLLSITKYTKNPLHVYVMTMDLQELDARNVPIRQEQMDYLEEMIKQVNMESEIHLLDISEIFKEEMLKSPNLKTNYTPYTLVRLFADRVEELPAKILYLDTDTIAKDSIEPIFDIDISEYEFAGVRDFLGKWFINIHYMNAGILYLNMEKVKETNLFYRARKMCMEKKMWFPDQTALNRLVKKKLFIPRKYNEQRRLHKDTVIQHFCKSIRFLPYYHTVNIKPWEVEKVRKVYKIHAYDDILEEYLERIKSIRTC